MSRRTKLILLGIFLLLLAIPIWHVGSNWAPANPLRFRLISRERLPALEWEKKEEEGYHMEGLEIEVRNTSTSPRSLEIAQVQWCQGKTDAAAETFSDLVDPFAPVPVIPPGGTWRGICRLNLPETGSATANSDPGDVRIPYTHASTFRKRVFKWYTWCESLYARYFPESMLLRSLMDECTLSEAMLENFA